MIYGFSISIGYNRIFFEKNDANFRKKLFATGQGFNLCCSLFFALIIINNGDWISKYIFDFDGGGFFLKLISIITIIEVMTLIPFNNLRVRKKAVSFVTVSIIQLVVTVAFTNRSCMAALLNRAVAAVAIVTMKRLDSCILGRRRCRRLSCR